AMHHHIGGIEALLEKTLVRLEHKLRRHFAPSIGEHAVLGNNDIALDPARLYHRRAGLTLALARGSRTGSGCVTRSPSERSWRVTGSASGCSCCRKPIIFSSTSLRRSEALPALDALISARTSMVVFLQLVTCSTHVLPSQFAEAAKISSSFLRMASIGAR